MPKVRTKKMLIDGVQEKVVIEDDYRKNLILTARNMGCEPELRQIFDRYDTLLRNCSNEKEAKAISCLGIKAVSDLLDNGYLGVGNVLRTADGQIIVESKDKSSDGK